MHAKNFAKDWSVKCAKPCSRNRALCQAAAWRICGSLASGRRKGEMACPAVKDHEKAAEARLASLIDTAG